MTKSIVTIASVLLISGCGSSAPFKTGRGIPHQVNVDYICRGADGGSVQVNGTWVPCGRKDNGTRYIPRAQEQGPINEYRLE